VSWIYIRFCMGSLNWSQIESTLAHSYTVRSMASLVAGHACLVPGTCLTLKAQETENLEFGLTHTARLKSARRPRRSSK